MKLNPASRVKLKVIGLQTTFDPTDSTVEVGVDDVWFPATWRTDPEPNLGATKWTRDAETDEWFCGPEADAYGANVLDAGEHTTEVRLTNPSGQVVVFRTDDLTVAE